MWSTVEVEPLANAAMTTLLLHLAAAAGVKVGGPADWDAIPRIIGWLQGHPLALTLVVPLMRKRPIHWVWQELQKQPLKGIAAAFDASYRQLKDLQRMLFTRLSVFGIPFELEAAAAVLAGEEGADEALDALDGLWQHALLGFDGGHYAYHALVRQYAYARLKEREDEQRVHHLAAEYLDAKLASAGGTAEEALERVDQWEKSGVWERFARSASALVGSLDRMGYWGEIEERLEHALASVRQHEQTAKLQAVLLGDLGTIAYKSARWDRAIEFYEQALGTMKQVGDIHGMAQTYNNLGMVYADKGEWDRAIEFYEQSLKVKEQVGDIHGMAQTYNNLGWVYARKGEWDRAIEFYEQSLKVKEQVGDIHGMASTYGNLGSVYARKGEWDRAIEFYERSLAVTEKMGDWVTSANQYVNLAVVYLQTNRPEQAKPLLARAYLIFTKVGSPNAQSAAAALVQACGSVEAANAYLEQTQKGTES
jgi:tetratricopeptide (TPR) repeat protein